MPKYPSVFCIDISQDSENRSVLYALFFALIAGFIVPSADALEIEQLWVADPDMIMEGAPMVADLDGDGDDEILTAAYENMIVIDGTGKELWRFDSRGRYSTYPAILKRDGQSPLIYAGDNKGMFTCLDGAGNVVWQTDMGQVFCSGPALADLNGDGTMELIQGEQGGMLRVLDAMNGKEKWNVQLEGACSCPAVADLDNDGSLEIVIATGKGKIIALDASGNTVWEFDMGSEAQFWAICSPVIFADSAGQTCIASGSSAGRIYCLNTEGHLLWERTVRGSVASTLSVGDFDADGRADLFLVTELGVVYRLNEDGRVLWDIDTQGRSLAPGAIIDLDGDGTLEYMLSTQRGNLLVFNGAGEIVFSHQFNNRTINMTAAFGDIVRERPGLEFAVTGGESGMMFCFGVPAPVDTAAQWRTYRADNHLTGTWFGLSGTDEVRMTPENLEWDRIVSGDDITFQISNPMAGDEILKAQASCGCPDGSRQVAVGQIVGKKGLLKIPITVTAPGVYRFEWMLKDAVGSTLVSGSREITLHPYRNDQALAKRAVLALQEIIGDSEVSTNDRGLKAVMLREARAIEKEAQALESLQDAAPGSPPSFCENLFSRTAALNSRAKRALALADTATSILKNAPDSKVVAFEGTMWENRDVELQLPEDVKIPLEISRRCVPGEHEPVSIKLLNVTLDPVRVAVHSKTQSGGPAVTAYEVKQVPTNLGTFAWDPIVSLEGGKLTIPPLETREVWFDIDLSNVQAGMHKVDVVFDLGADRIEAAIALEVLPFAMAGPDVMRLCCWASYNDDAVNDLLAHGGNVFTAGLPPVAVGEGDSPQLKIDFTTLDKFIAPFAGYDVFLLMNGIPNLGVPMESEAYVPRLADYFDQVMKHMESKGITEDCVALYPHDEPGGHGWDTVNHYILFARQGLKARPSLQFYVNGGGDLAMFEALNEVASIWCPSFYMFAEDTPEMEFIRKSGKILWSYDCGYAYARPIGANTKTINVVAQYRMQAVHGFNFGTDGIGYWCYNVGESLWGPVGFEYALVYVNEDGTSTSSRRWEAVRESMEDVRILTALRNKLDDPAIPASIKKQIRALLNGTVDELSRQTLKEAQLGVARYMLDASNNDATVEQFRNEMMDCIKSLAK